MPRSLTSLRHQSAVVAALLLVAAGRVSAQDTVVAGTVVTAGSLLPIANAEVVAAGTTTRVLTDASGRFRLDAPSSPSVILVVRRLGYRPVTDTVLAGNRNVQLSLTQAAVALDEIVVTGTAGATQMRAVGNAVSKTTVAEVLQNAPVIDVQQVLTARVPGVVVMPTQGVVGTGGVTRVRGISSLFLPNEPLIYVDGMRVDNNPRAGPSVNGGAQVARINDLDPQDIESLEVIKGPAAGTLYGTEASRGVIQILTRRGTPGPPRFALTVKQGANWFMNPEGRIPWVFGRDSLTGALDSASLYVQEVNAGRPVFRTGHPLAFGGSVSGGTQNMRYYASANYDRDEGVVTYNWRNRLTTRANLSILPSDNVSIETSLGIVRNRVRLGESVALWNLMTQFYQGSLPSQAGKDTRLRGFLRATPEDVARVDARSYTDRALASVQLRHDPARWFSQRLTLGMDIGDETSSQLFPSDPAGANGPFGTLSTGNKTVNRQHVTLGSLDYGASLTLSLGSDIRAVTSSGAQFYDKRTDLVSAQGSNFPVGVSVVGGAAISNAGEDVIQTRSVGVFAQQQWGWKNRAFLTGALRADDNSAFGENFDAVIYPKLSASWVLSEEPFWRGPLSTVNTLKLRGAWGVAGQQPDAFAAVLSYQPITTSGGGSALTPQNVGNPDLKPERGEELEVGFDAGLFGDRVATAFTYYRQRIRDALVPRALEPSRGFPGTQLVNLGQVWNRGVELSVDARVVNRRSLGWDLGFAFSTNHSRVVSLGGAPPVAGGNATAEWHIEGYPIAAFFMPLVVSASLDANGNAVNILCAGGPEPAAAPAPCDNSARQRVYSGPAVPTWSGSARATLTLFRNLRLYGLIDFRGGYNFEYVTAAAASNVGANTRLVHDRTDPIYLAYVALGNQGVRSGNARLGLVDAGFAKLREVSVSYTAPRALAARIGGSAATISVAGRNLGMLWQAQKEVFGVKVLDPEQRGGGDIARALNSLPPYAQFMIALRLSF